MYSVRRLYSFCPRLVSSRSGHRFRTRSSRPSCPIQRRTRLGPAIAGAAVMTRRWLNTSADAVNKLRFIANRLNADPATVWGSADQTRQRSIFTFGQVPSCQPRTSRIPACPPSSRRIARQRSCIPVRATSSLPSQLNLLPRMPGGYEVMITPLGILRKVGSPAGAMKGRSTRLDRLHRVFQIVRSWEDNRIITSRISASAATSPTVFLVPIGTFPDQTLARRTIDAGQSDRKPATRRSSSSTTSRRLRHTVKLEVLGAPEPRTIYPRLLSAKGRCPPPGRGAAIPNTLKRWPIQLRVPCGEARVARLRL